MPRLLLSEFEYLDVLAQASSSTVMRLRNKHTGQITVGKRIVARGPDITSKATESRTRADKVTPAMAHAADSVDACQREAHLLYRLGRQGVAVVNLLGICGSPVVGAQVDGVAWLVMELCQGGPLQDWLRRLPATSHGVVRQILEAVQHLHSLRVCHLDLKPSSVVLTAAGRVRLCSFGMAQHLDASGQRLGMRISGDEYKAPEILRDDTFCGVKADVFSLGRTLQAVATHAAAWHELPPTCTRMTGTAPASRPDLTVVQQTLFSKGWHSKPGPIDVPSAVETKSEKPSPLRKAKAIALQAISHKLAAGPPKCASPVTALSPLPKADLQIPRPPEPVPPGGLPDWMTDTLLQASRLNPSAHCDSVLCRRLGVCVCLDSVPDVKKAATSFVHTVTTSPKSKLGSLGMCSQAGERPGLRGSASRRSLTP